MANVETGGPARIQVTANDETAFIRGDRVLARAIAALDLLKDEDDELPVPVYESVFISIAGGADPLYFTVGQGAKVDAETVCLNRRGQFQKSFNREHDGFDIKRVDKVELRTNPKTGEHKAVLIKNLDVPDPLVQEEEGYFYIKRWYTVRDLGKLSIAVVSAAEFDSRG